MSFNSNAVNGLIFYSGLNYGGNPLPVSHGETTEVLSATGNWDARSVSITDMQAFVFSPVNTGYAAMSYLLHTEALGTASVPDLPTRYPDPYQLPLTCLGLDPQLAAVVWMDIDAQQPGPNALASTAQVGGSTTSLTTLSLPGRSGALGFVGLSEGSSVVANCRYGDYSGADGTVAWSGSGTVVMEYTGGTIILLSTSGFPDGWTFSEPQKQADGTWRVALQGGVPATDTIDSLTASPQSIVDDGVSASVVTAYVVDGGHLPAAGVTVNWSTTLGSLSVTSSVTGSDGYATTILTDKDMPGTATVTAAITGSSKSVDVQVSAGSSGHIKVMGARKSRSYIYHHATPDSLIALDSVSLLPVECNWRYDGEVEIQTGSRFTDTTPEKLLSVTPVNGGHVRLLNPCNIVGNGADNQSASSFTARMDGGAVTSWGYAGTGGTPPVSSRNDNIVMMATRIDAMLALNSEGQIFEWGGEMYDSTIPPEIDALSDITFIDGGEWYFTAVRSNGQVITWGSYSAVIPLEIQTLTDIITTITNEGATTALRANGQIVAWGNSTNGGLLPDNIAALGDIVSIAAGTRSFAALRAGGQVVAWGSHDEGGSVPAEIASLSDIVHITAGDFVYVALRTNGKLVAWGKDTSGGTVPSGILALSDIVCTSANWVSCAALRANGQVVAWGNVTGGGEVPANIATLTDIVAITESERAYAALRANGEVVAWGDPAYGGNIPANIAPMLTGVVAIYGSYQAFCALKDDNTVVVWGGGQAGDINEVPLNLQGAITYSYEIQ
jgi:hypothetical protein